MSAFVRIKGAQLSNLPDATLRLAAGIYDGSPMGMALFSTDLRLLQYNAALGRMSTVDLDKAVGNHVSESFPAAWAVARQQMTRVAAGQSELEQAAVVASSTAGEFAKRLLMFYPVKDDNGLVLAVAGLVSDVTAEAEAQLLAERRESQLRIALDAAQMGTWVWGLSSGELTWNDTMRQMFGVDDDHLANIDNLLEQIHEDDVSALRNDLDEALGTRNTLRTEFRVVRPDGTIRWILSRGQVQLGPDGEPETMLGISLDITDQRALADANLKTALRQARAAEQAIRMQRVTAALSEAMTVSQVSEVLLREAPGIVESDRGGLFLLSDDRSHLRSISTFGYTATESASWQTVSLDRDVPIVRSALSGRPTLCRDRDDFDSQFPGMSDYLHPLTHATAAFPLVSNNDVLGTWFLSWRHPRDFAEGELIILLTVSAQCAQALERARLYERERFISTALQRTLLPQRLPTLPGASTARRYRASAAGVEVGGDWYDVIQLPNNRVGLVIGDVGGHNIDAAAIMGQLRNAVRSYAWEGHPAANVLQYTNRMLAGLEPGVLATCCYVDLSLEDGIASVALAGHPPPLVISEDGEAEFMAFDADPPLGTESDRKFEQTTLFLSPHDTIVLYTDGLIEERNLAVTAGMERLRQAASRSSSDNIEELATTLLRSATHPVQEDDIALLLLRFEPQPKVANPEGLRTVRRQFPSSPASAGVARRFVSDVLVDWGAEETIDTVMLCVSELVTNSLIHTPNDVEVVLGCSDDFVRVDVIDSSDRLPVVRHQADSDMSGRGLHIVEAVATDWGVETLRSGKSVWFCISRQASR